MAVRPPEPTAPGTGAPIERFPLAARALRVSTARPNAGAIVIGMRSATTRAAAPRAAAQPATKTRNNWALYLFLFLLPLQNIHTGYLPNLGGGLNFLNAGFALSLIGAWIMRGRLAAGETVNRWVLIYAAYAIISLLVSYQYVTGTSQHFNALKDHLLGLSLLFLVQMSVHDWTGVRRIVLATLLPLPYIAKVVWVQHDSVSSWHYSDDLRIKGTFPLLGANEFAAFCVTMAIVLFALLIASKASRKWRMLFAGGVVCMVFGVIYAYSRTAYISLILGLVTVIL
ncbi:MAG: hypothetical protein ABJA62_11660, partial [Luteimonas sp.]